MRSFVFLQDGIIPAGVAHRKVDEGHGFSCLSAYPDGQDYDMKFGKPGEKEFAEEQIRRVPLPGSDPLYGSDGPLIKNWLSNNEQNRETL